MGAVVAQSVITRAQRLLHDLSNTHWSSTELLEYLNEGQRQIAAVVPTSYVKSATSALTAGSMQALPVDGQMLVDVPMMSTGQYVRRANFKDAGAFSATPEAASTIISEFWYNPATPKVWWCWPPSDAAGSVYLQYAAVPADIAIGAAILIDDVWEPALLNWILFRALSKEKQTKDNVRADLYLSAFNAAVGGSAQGAA